MKRTHRILAALCIIITLTTLTFNVYGAEPSMSNFNQSLSYKPGQFPDISENEWSAITSSRLLVMFEGLCRKRHHV